MLKKILRLFMSVKIAGAATLSAGAHKVLEKFPLKPVKRNYSSRSAGSHKLLHDIDGT